MFNLSVFVFFTFVDMHWVIYHFKPRSSLPLIDSQETIKQHEKIIRVLKTRFMPFQGTIYFINNKALLEAHTESTLEYTLGSALLKHN